MELVKIINGRITIPQALCEYLGVKDGDKIALTQENGKVIVSNASIDALREIQNSFYGVAEQLGIKNEGDVVDMVKEIRTERSSEYQWE